MSTVILERQATFQTIRKVDTGCRAGTYVMILKTMPKIMMLFNKNKQDMLRSFLQFSVFSLSFLEFSTDFSVIREWFLFYFSLPIGLKIFPGDSLRFLVFLVFAGLSLNSNWVLGKASKNTDLQAGIGSPTLQCRSLCHYPCWISDCVVHLIVCSVVWWLANQRPRKCDMTFVLTSTYLPSSRWFVAEP